MVEAYTELTAVYGGGGDIDIIYGGGDIDSTYGGGGGDIDSIRW